MTTQFAFDLRLSRRKTGLTQGDCALLLDIQQSRFSDFERGAQTPNLAELCQLAIILNRTFDTLFEDELKRARAAVQARIISIPKSRRNTVLTFNRSRTIKRLHQTLNDKPQHDGSS